jgi:hypothetical protein
LDKPNAGASNAQNIFVPQKMIPELKILERLIRDGDKAFADPDTARALCIPKASFKDSLIAFACSAILLHDGDWQGAKECVRMNRDLDLGRVKKLIAWGDKIAPKQEHEPAIKPQ